MIDSYTTKPQTAYFSHYIWSVDFIHIRNCHHSWMQIFTCLGTSAQYTKWVFLGKFDVHPLLLPTDVTFIHPISIHFTLHWRHNERDGVSNHRRYDCLLNCLFRRKSKKTSKLRITGFVRGIHRSPVNSPHQGPVMRIGFHLMSSSWMDHSESRGRFIIKMLSHQNRNYKD